MVPPMQIINDFGEFLLRSPSNDIRDISILPHPKKDIKEAIFSSIKEGVDENTFKVMSEGLYLLADFQEGVGIAPLSKLSVDLTKVPENDAEWDSLVDNIANNSNKATYDSFNGMVVRERLSIKGELAKLTFVTPIPVSQDSKKLTPKNYIGSKHICNIKWNYGSIAISVLIVITIINYIFRLKQDFWVLVFYTICITPFISGYVKKRI